MPALVGIALALVVSAFARVVGFDRDRAFYPTTLVVIASLYLLFAVMVGSTQALLEELPFVGVFVGAAVIGFRRSPWIVVAGLALHGLLDAVHGRVVVNAGVPPWWPAFCLVYDVTAAAVLGVLITTSPKSGPPDRRGVQRRRHGGRTPDAAPIHG